MQIVIEKGKHITLSINNKLKKNNRSKSHTYYRNYDYND